MSFTSKDIEKLVKNPTPKFFIKDETKMIPKEGDLDVFWYWDKGFKIYTVICNDCGNNQMLECKKEDIVWAYRCGNCSAFHSVDSFIRQSRKARRAAKFEHKGRIKRVPQPFLEQWERWKILNRHRYKEITPDNVIIFNT